MLKTHLEPYSYSKFQPVPVAAAILVFVFCVNVFAQTSRRESGQVGRVQPNSAQTVQLPSEGKVGDVIKNSIGIELVWVPPGEFTMGSTEADIAEAFRQCKAYDPKCSDSLFAREGPQRRVTIGKGFWIGRYEITQGQWRSVMGTNPSYNKRCNDRCPADSISWLEAKRFIEKLNLRKDGFIYSLPSEAEWEYAARAGTSTPFNVGDSISSNQANFNGKYPFGKATAGPSIMRTVEVGNYAPNAWGLFDVHGNVWEWTEDFYTSYTDGGLPVDGSAKMPDSKPDRLTSRALRGGAFFHTSLSARSAFRISFPAQYASPDFGFRVVAKAVTRK